MEIKQMNEPVAWMSKEDFEDYLSEDKRVTSATVFNFKLDIPLYTHPVSQYKAITNTKIEPTVVSYTHPVKELTDEEIANTWDDVRKDATLKPSMKDMQDFARAILRKAQEK